MRLGHRKNTTSFKPQSIRELIFFSSSFSFQDLVKFGSNTVPSATPNKAVGNSIILSAYDNQDTLPGSSLDAIFVLIIRLSWATETASVAGNIKDNIFRILWSLKIEEILEGVLKMLKDNASNNPIFFYAQICSVSWEMPPKTTAITRAHIEISKLSLNKTVLKIKEIFNKTGVIAGILNSEKVFKIPELRATREIKKMYGINHLVISTVN